MIAAAAPTSSLVDLTHGIAPGDVRTGALALARALPFTPAGVHLAVVDPGVGADRRALALRTAEEGRFLVGPDNGLLVPAAEKFGGAAVAVDIGLSPARLEPVSATFHGRDIFAPVAAKLAMGVEDLTTLGEPVDPSRLVKLELPEPEIAADSITAHVIGHDHFGNVQLNVSHEQLLEGPLRLGSPIVIEAGEAKLDAVFARTFAEVPDGALLAYEDASRTLAIAVNRGSAVTVLGLQRDAEIRLRPR